MRSETIQYEADGSGMRSELFVPDRAGGNQGRRPGVLLFPEVFGLAEHALTRARRLAELGYVVLACDPHGDRRVLPREEASKYSAAMRADVARMRRSAQAALEALRQRTEVDAGKIAAIGFCFGGSLALELARSGAELVAVVGFHSGLGTQAPQDAGRIKGKVLVCIGADDPSVPPEQRAAFEQEMRAGKVNWQLTLFGGVVHSFTNPEADKRGRPEHARYDPQADQRSWQQMCELFGEVF